MSITLTPSLSLAAHRCCLRLLRRFGVGATPECGLALFDCDDGGGGGCGVGMFSTWDSGRNHAMPAVLARDTSRSIAISKFPG